GVVSIFSGLVTALDEIIGLHSSRNTMRVRNGALNGQMLGGVCERCLPKSTVIICPCWGQLPLTYGQFAFRGEDVAFEFIDRLVSSVVAIQSGRNRHVGRVPGSQFQLEEVGIFVRRS